MNAFIVDGTTAFTNLFNGIRDHGCAERVVLEHTEDLIKNKTAQCFPTIPAKRSRLYLHVLHDLPSFGCRNSLNVVEVFLI